MIPPRIVLGLTLLALVQAHGGHGGGGDSYDEHGADLEGLGYAERHMRSEHHIDAFDPESFFHLHDLDHDGVLSIPEIEAIYGLHHDSSIANHGGKGDAHSAQAAEIVSKVLSVLDKDGDGIVTLKEFTDAGNGGLPDFKGAHLGHHYDEESEYFLHHEELYHSTPETQTDEAYIHPEDLEHFAHHEHIEAVEDSRAQAFLEAESETHADLPHEAPPSSGRANPGEYMNSNTNKNPAAVAAAKGGNVRGTSSKEGEGEGKKNETATEGEKEVGSGGGSRKAPPSVAARMEGVKKVAQEDLPYGEGEAGFARPRTEREKLRRGTPYKYKFRRGARKEF